LSIVGPSEIASRDQVGGNAGAITVRAQSMELDGWGIFDAGIFSEAVYGSTRGNAGDIAVTVADAITMRGRGRVETHTASVGDAGRVDISARSILLDATDGPGATGIYSNGDFFSSGNAQAIHIDVGDLVMLKGANIASISEWDGNAGTIDINAASITMKGLGEYTPIKTTSGVSPRATPERSPSTWPERSRSRALPRSHPIRSAQASQDHWTCGPIPS
jgi:hypothetical protein